MFTISNVLLKDFSNKFLFHLSRRSKKYVAANRKNKALEHFDDFYKSLFKSRWPSVRLGLLSKGKKIAVINNFGNVNEASEKLKQEGAIELKSYLEYLKSQNHEKSLKTVSKENEKHDLDNKLTNKLQEAKEKDSRILHPEGKHYENLNEEENEEVGKKEENLFDITESRTSLHQDKLEAQIEMTRLILPDSDNTKSMFYDYIPATKLRGLENYILESDYYKYYSVKNVSKIEVVAEDEIIFPENLKVYSFDRGDVSSFPPPKLNLSGTYDYLEADGADLLPVLALDVKSGDYVLHLGFNSGALGYCLLQTLLPKYLICSGSKDFHSIFKFYLHDYCNNWNDTLYVTKENFLELDETGYDTFDKILVDVPCTNDKAALFDEEKSLFRISKKVQRLALPSKQTEILASALKLVRPGGTLVYTTSTLSPVQNEGVVSEALNLVWAETKSSYTVKDLSSALSHMSFFFNFDKKLQMKYGSLIVPFTPTNFGPRYFCKIVRNET